MGDFMIRFFICNIFISGIIGILLAAKWIFKNSLSCRMQYNLWFVLLGLLFVPFIPFRLISFPQIFSWLASLKDSPASNIRTTIEKAVNIDLIGTSNWMNDLTISVNREIPSVIGYILLGLWVAGILVMIMLIIKSALRLRAIEKSALPLQNPKIRSLYHRSLKEMGIVKNIPVYSTAFLKSPIITGFLKPAIYLPIHLISDHNESDIRYMLLHELQHYKHKDALTNHLMNLAGIIYWFNPIVWYALKEMRNDREVACDTSVLKMLDEDSYEDYGNTLINFAEKISLTPFPFVSSLGGNMKQMKRRIINIASYKTPTLRKKIKGITAFLLTAILLLGLTPFISIHAAEVTHYQWKTASETISYVDLSTYFGKYEGSFVLYDLENDAWCIYNLDRATLQVAPDSTYKIYDALFGLEEGVITPENSLLPWNGETYPFEAWNANQTLPSAMQFSVNWYFQAIDTQLGAVNLFNYLQKIEYGNKNISGDFSTYWLESSLKISPVEQVQLLTKLYNNSFGFTPENIHTVADSICLFSENGEAFYGKTGTGRVNGQDVNGWFIGYIEVSDHTYFFATNIGAEFNATGSNAAEITMSILNDMNIWK